MSKLIFALLVAWLSMSCIIDMVAVPTVFRTVSNLYQAGAYGIKVFGKFNKLELIFGLVIFVGLILRYRGKKIKFKKLILVLSFVCLFLAGLFTFHISPRIDFYHKQRKELVMETPEYQKNETSHVFYHELYKKLEGVKLILLLILIVLVNRDLKNKELV